MPRLCHLHNHSTFSFLDGYGRPDQIVARAKELGHDAVAITDHGNVVAHVPFWLATKGTGVKPIYGCEAYLVSDHLHKAMLDPVLGIKAFPHITLIAANQRGYQNLLALQRVSWMDGMFNGKPRIDSELLWSHQEGLIVLSGCVFGWPSRYLWDETFMQLAGPAMQEKCAEWLQLMNVRLFKSEGFYVELTPQPGFPRCDWTFGTLAKIATDLGLPIVMTADGHFPSGDLHDVQSAMYGLNINKDLDKDVKNEDGQTSTGLPAYQYMCSADELTDRALGVLACAPHHLPRPTAAEISQWIDRSYQIGQDIEDFGFRELRPAKFWRLDKDTSASVLLWREAWAGLARRVLAGQVKGDDWWRAGLPTLLTSSWLTPQLTVGSGPAISTTDMDRLVSLAQNSKQFQCTELSTNIFADRFPTGLTSTTSAEIKPALSLATLSLLPGKKTSGAELNITGVSAGLAMNTQNAIPTGMATSDIVEGVELTARHYFERAVKEFRGLNAHNFCDYILIVADIVNHVKSLDGLVMLRGSAGGCLLLWLLGASETDPMKFGLSFERFYDENRPDPPDVDADFEQGFRAAAVDYAREKYGKGRVAQIAALSALQAKGALADAARHLDIPRDEYAILSACLDSNDEDAEGQFDRLPDIAREVLDRHPKLRRLVPLMIGQFRQPSVHACGILITDEPMADVVGVMQGKEGHEVVQLDKNSVKKLGGLKLDLLSVSAYDVVGESIRQVAQDNGQLAAQLFREFYRMSFDESETKVAETLATADKGHLCGVFQLEGHAAARVAASIGIHTFEDLVAASALCRPGPADWIETYKTNKADAAVFERFLAQYHPAAQAVIKPTFGILLYQEQVMRLARELAGMEWPEVHKLRKGVCDKLGLDPNTGDAWRQEWGTKFIVGCLHNGVELEEAKHWWNSVQSHGGYSFNRSHCVTYGVIGFWTLWLKTHHSDSFYLTSLEMEGDPTKRRRLMTEYMQQDGAWATTDGTGIVSGGFTQAGVRSLIAGVREIKGIGPKLAQRLRQVSVNLGGFAKREDFLQEVPSNVRKALVDSRLLEGDPTVMRHQMLIGILPGLPVRGLEPQHEAMIPRPEAWRTRNRKRLMCNRESFEVYKAWALSRREQIRPDIWGYVTDRTINNRHAHLTVEDGGDMPIIVKIAKSKRVTTLDKWLEPKCRPTSEDEPWCYDGLGPVAVGDFIEVCGWSRGDEPNIVYANEHLVVHARAARKEKSINAEHADGSGDGGQQLPKRDKAKRAEKSAGNSDRRVLEVPAFVGGTGTGEGEAAR